ncbi:hypothetical protein MMC24_001202 [Lignoscripta atroalba]|nr:hypothetical protein [Lignoscripta atroalba]
MQLPWRLATVISALSLCYNVNANSRSRNPLNYLSLVEDPVIHTPSHRVHALSHFDLTFNLHQSQQQVKLSLEPNHDILAQDASVDYLDSSGNVIRTEPIDRSKHRVYKGSAWIEQYGGNWVNVGWARIVVRRDGINPLFEGAFTILHDNHHIQFRSNYLQTKHALDPHAESGDDEYMVIFRDSDIGEVSHAELKRSEFNDESSCSAQALSFNSDLSHPIFANTLKRDVGFWGSMPVSSVFGKRQIDTTGIPGSGGNSAGVNLRSSIGNTEGCPTTRKVALIGVVTDCSYTATFNSSDAAGLNVITQINSASDLYERTFNITLGLQNLTVTEAVCPGTAPPATPWNIGCGGNTTITDRLNLFSRWRGDRKDTNAYWTLLTNCATGAEVGLAWLGQACVNDVTEGGGESVSGANIVAKTSTEWQVIAHESGHTFGAVHDCDRLTCGDANTLSAQQCCPLSSSSCDAGQQYIMNPSTGPGISQFSPSLTGAVFLITEASQLYLDNNVGMESLKMARTVTAEALQIVTTINVAIPQPAGSRTTPSAMIRTKIVVKAASSHRLTLCAEPALASAIQWRPALAPVQIVLQTRRPQTAKLVATELQL